MVFKKIPEFEKYVPLEVLRHLHKRIGHETSNEEEVWKNIEPPDSNQLLVVSLFADVSGFTKLSETLSNMGNNDTSFEGTDTLAKNINEYMKNLSKELFQKGFDVIKFAGDALVAIFKLRLTEEESERLVTRDLISKIIAGKRTGERKPLRKKASKQRMVRKKQPKGSDIENSDDDEVVDVAEEHKSIKDKLENCCEYVCATALQLQNNDLIKSKKLYVKFSQEVIEENRQRNERNETEKALAAKQKQFGSSRAAQMLEDSRNVRRTGFTIARNLGKNTPKEDENDDLMMKVKFGIGAGEINIGHIGGARDKWHGKRLEYVAVGEALKQAYDAEARCRPGQVVLSRVAWKAVRNRVRRTKKKRFLPLRNNNVYGRYCKDKLSKKDGEAFYHITENTVDNIEVDEEIKNFVKFRKMSEYTGKIPEYVVYSFIPLSVKPYLEVTEQSIDDMLVNEIRKVTTLFCNLNLTAEQQSNIQNNQQGAITDLQNMFKKIQMEVFRLEGQINKFLIDDKGSTLLIAFGLPPLAHEDDAARGATCAATLLDQIPTCKIGISTGMAYCGVIGGGSKRKEYTVLGDSINVAARLMAKVGNTQNTDNANADTDSSRMLIDYETRLSLTRTQNQLQFDKISPKFKLKGKTSEVQAFAFNTYYTSGFGQNSNTLNIFCSVINQTKYPERNGKKQLEAKSSIKMMKKSDTVGALLAKSNAEDDVAVVWHKTAKINDSIPGQVVHPDEKLAQLAAEANADKMLFFELVNGPEVSAGMNRGKPKLLKDDKFKYDLSPVEVPKFRSAISMQLNPRSVKESYATTRKLIEKNAGVIMPEYGKTVKWPETMYHYGAHISTQSSIGVNRPAGIWYQCKDTMSVITTLGDAKKSIFKGLQILFVEGAPGVGKSFAINHVFNNNTYNVSEDYQLGGNLAISEAVSPMIRKDTPRHIVANIKCSTSVAQGDSPFYELGLLLLKLAKLDPKTFAPAQPPLDDKRAAMLGVVLKKNIEDAFEAGKEFLNESTRGDEDLPLDLFGALPDRRDLYLINQFLVTEDKKLAELFEIPAEIGEAPRVSPTKSDMNKIFSRDHLLEPGMIAMNKRGSLTLFNQSLQEGYVDTVLALLSTIFIGFCQIFGGLVVVFENAQYLGPLTYAVILQLCNFQKNLNITFVLPRRRQQSIYSNKHLKSLARASGTHDLKKELIPTSKAVRLMIDNHIKSFQREERKSHVSGNFQGDPVDDRHLSGVGTKMVPEQPSSNSLRFFSGAGYPLADMIADAELVRIRLMGFTCCSLVQVKARKEYTRQLIQNMLESKSIPRLLERSISRKTSGNPIFIKETLHFYQEKNLLKPHTDDTSAEAKAATDLVARNSVNFKNILTDWSFDDNTLNMRYIKHVPPMVESYCAMVVDQFDVYGQLALKVAAMLSSFGSTEGRPEGQGRFRFSKILSCHPLSSQASRVKIESAWDAILATDIIQKEVFVLEDQEKEFRFVDEWLRMCLLRKLTRDVRDTILKKSSELRQNYEQRVQRNDSVQDDAGSVLSLQSLGQFIPAVNRHQVQRRKRNLSSFARDLLGRGNIMSGHN